MIRKKVRANWLCTNYARTANLRQMLHDILSENDRAYVCYCLIKRIANSWFNEDDNQKEGWGGGTSIYALENVSSAATRWEDALTLQCLSIDAWHESIGNVLSVNTSKPYICNSKNVFAVCVRLCL